MSDNEIETKQTKRKLEEALDLIDAMVMELRFRGCEDHHKLVLQARRLRQSYKS